MKKFFLSILNKLRSCGLCHGLGVRELPNGDTKQCYNCKGKGVI